MLPAGHAMRWTRPCAPCRSCRARRTRRPVGGSGRGRGRGRGRGSVEPASLPELLACPSLLLLGHTGHLDSRGRCPNLCACGSVRLCGCLRGPPPLACRAMPCPVLPWLPCAVEPGGPPPCGPGHLASPCADHSPTPCPGLALAGLCSGACGPGHQPRPALTTPPSPVPAGLCSGACGPGHRGLRRPAGR